MTKKNISITCTLIKNIFLLLHPTDLLKSIDLTSYESVTEHSNLKNPVILIEIQKLMKMQMNNCLLATCQIIKRHESRREGKT